MSKLLKNCVKWLICVIFLFENPKESIRCIRINIIAPYCIASLFLCVVSSGSLLIVCMYQREEITQDFPSCIKDHSFTFKLKNSPLKYIYKEWRGGSQINHMYSSCRRLQLIPTPMTGCSQPLNSISRVLKPSGPTGT